MNSTTLIIVVLAVVMLGGGGFYGRGAGWFTNGSPYGYGFGGFAMLLVVFVVLILAGLL